MYCAIYISTPAFHLTMHTAHCVHCCLHNVDPRQNKSPIWHFYVSRITFITFSTLFMSHRSCSKIDSFAINCFVCLPAFTHIFATCLKHSYFASQLYCWASSDLDWKFHFEIFQPNQSLPCLMIPAQNFSAPFQLLNNKWRKCAQYFPTQPIIIAHNLNLKPKHRDINKN